MSNLIEVERLKVQAEIDSGKLHEERNKLGQFATPSQLALEILGFAKGLLKTEKKIRFLDPAIGTGSFYSALLRTFERKFIDDAVGVEIDRDFANAAKHLWSDSGLRVIADDFTILEGKPQFNLIISNPPYVRHHHLSGEYKARLRRRVAEQLDIDVSGLTGLYCYFLLLCHRWLSDDGIAGWLIPSEFMDVNYGAEIKRYLLMRVELIQIHRFDPETVQFDDALVSSAVIWFRKRKPRQDHRVKFTFGGTLGSPRIERTFLASDLSIDAKWTRFPAADIGIVNTKQTRLGDLILIRRGIATGNNRFFILSRDTAAELKLPLSCFRPVLPPPRLLQEQEIFSDDDGIPTLKEQFFLLDTSLPLDEIQKRFPSLAHYLREGEANDISKSYLCAHRHPWYSQEKREPAPILCTYMGRGTATSDNPFRFILNHSKAVATNVYLMLYPKPSLQSKLRKDPGIISEIWRALNKIPHTVLRGQGRVYGGGLHKLEPKELANVPLDIPLRLEDDPDWLFA